MTEVTSQSTFTMVEKLFKFLDSIQNGNLSWIQTQLHSQGVAVLTDFVCNRSTIEEFYRTFCSPVKQHVVLCGINQGRFGAGKTGVPFLDFKSLAQMLPNIMSDDEERSAQFFSGVVSEFGAKPFYDAIYVTHISCLGFKELNREKNVNYYDLNLSIIQEFYSYFLQEIGRLPVTDIIACGMEVEKSVILLKATGRIADDIKISYLPHPYYRSYTNRAAQWKVQYVDRIGQLISSPGANGTVP